MPTKHATRNTLNRGIKATTIRRVYRYYGGLNITLFVDSFMPCLYDFADMLYKIPVALVLVCTSDVMLKPDLN